MFKHEELDPRWIILCGASIEQFQWIIVMKYGLDSLDMDDSANLV